MTAALIVAAGRGSRAAQAGGAPKQYARLGSGTVLARTVTPFLDAPGVTQVQVVIHPSDGDLYREALGSIAGQLAPPVAGGATRQLSVLAGLEALANTTPPERVLIHDAARPFVDGAVIGRVIAALETTPGALAAEPVADTLKRSGPDGRVAVTLDRAGLWRAQTPQGFHFKPILEAHRRAAAEGRSDFTDDAAIAEWAGLPVALVAGSPANSKITSAEDLAMAQRALGGPTGVEWRTGLGFDVHAFTSGDHVWLCGVRIPHDAALDGHSDADAALHALTDALLGAIGDGDIGDHFPPSDPRWRGAPSRLFLEDAARRVAARGGRIGNVDITILAEAPRIGPHRDAMRTTVAAILGIDSGRVGVKATTTERLGFVGRRDGLAAMATATVALPC